jgi:hypothetical protein
MVLPLIAVNLASTYGGLAGAASVGVGATGGVTALGVIQTAMAVAAVGGTVAGIQQSKEAASQARKANRVRLRVSEVANRRARLKALNQARVQAARVANIGGAAPGSAAQGAVGSIASTTAGNIGFQSLRGRAERSIFAAEQRSATATSRARTAGAVSDLALQAGGQGQLNSIFENLLS